MPAQARLFIIPLVVFLSLTVGCVTTDTASRESRHKREAAPDRAAPEPAAASQIAPVKPAAPKGVFKPVTETAVKTVQLGQTPIYAAIPEHWQVREDTAFRFSLSARDEGNILVRKVVNEKDRFPLLDLLSEGIRAAAELPRPLIWVKPPAPNEPFKKGNIWYQEATYRYKGVGGRLIRGLHLMNARGTIRAHAFLYSQNDNDLPGLKQVAESITFK